MSIERRLRELAFLERIVRATAATRDYAVLLSTVVQETTEATVAEVCSIYLWDESERLLTLTATNGLSQAAVGHIKLGLGEGVTGWVAAQRQSVAVRDVHYESRFHWVPGLDDERFTSMLSVPIVSLSRLVGVINVQTVKARVFSQDEVDFLSAVAAQIAGIIDLSRLHARAMLGHSA
jgi:signal transduction protein with GAF and PtsI domain